MLSKNHTHRAIFLVPNDGFSLIDQFLTLSVEITLENGQIQSYLYTGSHWQKFVILKKDKCKSLNINGEDTIY